MAIQFIILLYIIIHLMHKIQIILDVDYGALENKEVVLEIIFIFFFIKVQIVDLNIQSNFHIKMCMQTKIFIFKKKNIFLLDHYFSKKCGS